MILHVRRCMCVLILLGFPVCMVTWIDEEILGLLEVASTELHLSNEENRELQLQLKLKTELCELLEKESKSSHELIEQLEEELRVEKLTLDVLKEKFEILKQSGTSPIEGVVHEEEQKSVTEKIFFWSAIGEHMVYSVCHSVNQSIGMCCDCFMCNLFPHVTIFFCL